MIEQTHEAEWVDVKWPEINHQRGQTASTYGAIKTVAFAVCGEVIAMPEEAEEVTCPDCLALSEGEDDA